MTPDSWQRVKELFIAAEALKGPDRDAFLTSACGADLQLRAELDQLLSQHEHAGAFPGKPLARVPDQPISRSFVAGDVVGRRFVIESLLGAGGMGEVYRARDMRLQRLVAVKVLPRVLDDAEHRQRLEREARAVAALSHSNICSLYHVDTDGGRDYLILEYLEGKTLAACLNEGALPLSDCRRIANDITAALAYAHDRGVIHRDLKPANIMVTPQGTKVLDFGIAKRHALLASTGHPSDQDLTDTQTATGQIVGSVAYMSPEQAEGKPVDARSDVFSFGCVLYEMVTGSKAFRGETAASTLAAVLRAEPAPIRDLLPQAPPQLDQVLVKCLKKNAADRFQTMTDLGQALKDSWTPQSSMDVFGRGSRTQWRFAAVALSVAALSVALAVWYPRGPPGKVSANSVVVLPFANVGNDPELEYLADGLSESITNTLSSLPAVRVIARTTAFSYKGQNVDVRKIGRDLRVRVVVTGKISRTRDEVRTQADLVDTGDGAQIWGQQYTSTIGNTLSVQQDIVQNLATRLGNELTGRKRKELDRHSTHRSDAYDAYLKGRYALARFTIPELKKSIAFFQSALQADPAYALAYAGLADSYSGLSSIYIKPAEAMIKAKAAAERALAIDPALAEAHVSRGVVRGWYEFDWDRSEQDLKRALELKPSDASARLWYAWNLVVRGRFQDGIAEAKLAHELDPLSLYVETGLGQMYSYAGQHETAIKQMHSVVGSDPAFFSGHHYLGTIYVAAKQYGAAALELEQARKLDPSQPQPIAYLAYCRAMLGETQAANALIGELTDLSKTRYISGFLFAVSSLGLKQDSEAIDWLEKAYEERDDMLSLIGVDRLFDRLRSDPRFEALSRKAGFTTGARARTD